MRSRRAISVAAALIVGSAVFVGLGSTPAWAMADITFNSDGATRSAPASTPHIAGTVTAGSGCNVDQIVLKLTTTEGHPVPGDNTIPGNGKSSQDFSWQPALPKNGRYKITVEAKERPISVVSGCSGSTTTVERDLWLEMAPAPPAVTSVKVDSGQRTVTVRWNKNAEADLVGYLVYRAYEDESLVAVRGYEPNQFEHFESLQDGPAGDYRYELRVLRPSADWYVNDGSRRPPAASPLGAPGAGGTATLSSSGGSRGGDGDDGSGGADDDGEGADDDAQAGTSGRSVSGRTLGTGLRSTGSIDFSAFAAELDRARRNGQGEEFDSPFSDRLPFGPRTTIVTEEYQEEGLGEPIGTGEDRPTSLLMFAAGLLITAFVMHLLWLKGEVDRAPLEAVAPDGSIHPMVPDTPGAATLAVPALASATARPRVRRRPPGSVGAVNAAPMVLAESSSANGRTATATRVRRRRPV